MCLWVTFQVVSDQLSTLEAPRFADAGPPSSINSSGDLSVPSTLYIVFRGGLGEAQT
ncbi:hypothetical protein M413DRAFT_450144 [Hebeloma cylindrosporum]|uniref:Uncharacterized protein n=1 Tax=Hebeloma cylindrosporum TaxID=76867 RepID=A0A0C2Y0L6_HEBCY|nr:hypothetical protein M413DRAFT_450144 [Hebeloma cylindrosporum h7]